MTTSRFDTLDGIVLGVSVVMLVEGFLLGTGRRGLIERLFPSPDIVGRVLRSLIYFTIAGILFHSAWRR